MLKIIRIADADSVEIDAVCELAYKIWNEHYISIISKEQIEYMLENFQSSSAIKRQIQAEGYIYYLAYLDGNPAGYAGLIPKKNDGEIFLSKLYIDRQFRRRGISRSILSVILTDYPMDAYGSIRLTCNKYNENSIIAYKKMGFAITDSIVTSIGGGMVMDDFVMTMTRS